MAFKVKYSLFPLFLVLGLVLVDATSLAIDQTLYGPRTLKIGWWRIHLSRHKMAVDEPGEGTLIFNKKTPKRKIKNGFYIFNGKIISMREFLRGKGKTFEKPVLLKKKNRLFVYLRGKRGASISVELRKKAGEPPPPPEISFSAEPSSIITGESSILSWDTTHAQSVRIEPGIGNVDLRGSIVVSPTATTSYALVAEGPGGTASREVTVTVAPPPPQVELEVNPNVLEPGDACTLSWRAIHADSAFINNGLGNVTPEGAVSVTPMATTIYTITVTGPGGSATASAKVSIPEPPEDVDFGIAASEQERGGGLVGETICILNGNCVELREDLSLSSPHTMGLRFTGAYNSRSNRVGCMGHGWTHGFEASLELQHLIDGLEFVRILDHRGRAHYFRKRENGLYIGFFKEKTRLSAEGAGYVWSLLSGVNYGFQASGELIWIEDEKGNRLDIVYSKQGLVEKVTDLGSGRAIFLRYNADNLLDHITGPVTDAIPDGVWVRYGYDEMKNLISITYPDGSRFRYGYGGGDENGNLAEKRNALGHLLNTWSYDGQQRVVNSFSADGKGVAIEYVSDSQVEVTDAYGVSRTYIIEKIKGRRKVVAMNGMANAPYTESNAIRWVYDDNLRLIETEDAGGKINRYEDQDSRGNPGTIRLAVGTLDERHVTYLYHPLMNLPLSRTESSVLQPGGLKVTTWDYDNDYDETPNENPTGLLSQIIERGFTRDESGAFVPFDYVTKLQYNEKGQIISADGPLSGSQDAITMIYDASTGDLLSVTRPLIGATLLSDYDGAGRPGTIADVNGQSISYRYDGRGRPTAVITGPEGAATNVSYTLGGKPASITDPDNVTRTFIYDPEFGRLSRIADPEGNYIAYQYDIQGNLVEMGKYGPSGNRTAGKRWDYHHPAAPGKLFREISDDNAFIQYGYDDDGNIAFVIDRNGNSTDYVYDLLHRLISVIQPGDVATSYGYDKHGNLASIVDAQGNRTIYHYDDMGQLVLAESPDTGTTTYGYDGAGNLTSKRDAKGNLVRYSYDLLNRITAIRHTDPVDDIIYAYDGGANGKGRLTEMTDPSGKLLFGYDTRGRLVRKTHMINGQNHTLFRSYSPGGKVMDITYPSGRVMHYARDAMGRMKGLSTTYRGNETTLVSNMTYNPFGGPKGLSTGAGGQVSNEPGACECIDVTNPGEQMERKYTYDGNRNLLSITATNTPWFNQEFTYDALDRLKNAVGRYGMITYSYDKVGNRIQKNSNGEVDEYVYIPGTNQLGEIKGANPLTLEYDANGNTIRRGDRTLAYNQNNRLIRVEGNGDIIAEYVYNGLGQRVIKDAETGATIFHYDFDGQLIGESTPQGTFIKEYLYMGKIRMAMADPEKGATYFYLNDHLGTPEIMTDANGEIVWMAAYKPFGEANVHPNSTVVNNLRFPGQYYDQETDLHYNYHRYYDPTTGRYLTPDPIGLEGGINLFVYASDNPVNRVDPKGLFNPFGNLFRPIRFGGIRTDLNPLNIQARRLMNYASITAEYITCSVLCTTPILAGEAATQGAQFAAKKAAEKLAKEWVKKMIPYVGWISTTYSSYRLIRCFVDCKEVQGLCEQ